MSKKFLPRKLLADFLDILEFQGELHGPVLTSDGVYAFRPITSPEELDVDYQRTLIPPKKYLLPPQQTILTFSPPGGYQSPLPFQQPLVLFGLHPCDLAGIAYLDKVFMGEQSDPSYAERRWQLTLIGLSCEPDPACFCNETTIRKPENFDLFLDRTDSGFIITPGTKKGTGILQKSKLLVTPPPNVKIRPKMPRLRPSPARAAEGEFPESSLWDEFAARCFSCGACSACCPTCYCFDVFEGGGLDGSTAARIRSWDNCLFKAHGEVAGGINFRPTRLDRLHYRFLHKYRGFGPLRNQPSCVGCGRCGAVCPVGIDLLDLFRDDAKGGKGT